MQQPDDDRFIGVGEKTPEIDPNQTAIPSPEMVLEPTPSDLTDYLNANFVNKGGAVGGQWRGEHIWVEYGAGTIVIWNAKDMTYTHKTFGSADRDYIRRAIEWIKENKDVPQTSSEKAQKRTAELAEMWETNGRNPANQTENG